MQLYRSLLGIQSVRASARGPSHLLHITYDAPTLARSNSGKAKKGADAVELVLEFDPASKRLLDAQVSYIVPTPPSLPVTGRVSNEGSC